MKPVKSDYCFEAVSDKEMKRIFQSLPLNFNIWEEFEYFELTINQRQKEDLIYAQMLNRIRIGNQTEEDIGLLQQQVIPSITNDNNKINNSAEHYMELIKVEPSTIALFSTTSAVNKFNEIVCEKLGS